MRSKNDPPGGSKSLKNVGRYWNFNKSALLFARRKKHWKKGSWGGTWPPRVAPGLPSRHRKGPKRGPQIIWWSVWVVFFHCNLHGFLKIYRISIEFSHLLSPAVLRNATNSTFYAFFTPLKTLVHTRRNAHLASQGRSMASLKAPKGSKKERRLRPKRRPTFSFSSPGGSWSL